MRCDQCKHWADKPDEWEAEQVGFRKCAAVRARWEIGDEASEAFAQSRFHSEEAWEKFIAVRRDALQRAKAYVQDGSQYMASLWTAPDFFCSLFKTL